MTQQCGRNACDNTVRMHALYSDRSLAANGHNARRQLQAARNRRKGNHARIEGAPTDSCTP